MPPPYGWQEFQRRAKRYASQPRDHLDWRYMAAAAALLVVVVGIAVWARHGSGDQSMTAGTRESGHSSWTSGWRDTAPDPDEPLFDAEPQGPAENQALANKRSRAIETWLASLPREPVVVRVGTRAAVTRLEDQIAQVDDLLTSVSVDGMP